jgi:hypothetical protein
MMTTTVSAAAGDPVACAFAESSMARRQRTTRVRASQEWSPKDMHTSFVEIKFCAFYTTIVRIARLKT